MLLPLSRPACTSANVVSGGQGRSLPSSSLGQEAGRSGYFVFALMPTRSPSLRRLHPSFGAASGPAGANAKGNVLTGSEARQLTLARRHGKWDESVMATSKANDPLGKGPVSPRQHRP